MDTKICSTCGNTIDANTTYCTFCGAAQLPNARPEPYSAEPTPQQWPKQETRFVEPPVRKPPVPGSLPPPTIYSGEEGVGMGWIVFLRVFLWIVFALIIAGSAVYGCIVMDWGAVTEGILIILSGILSAFIIIAASMVSLNNASNQRKTASNTAKILQLLQDQRKK